MNKKLHIEIVKVKKSFPNADARDLVYKHITEGKPRTNEVVRCNNFPGLSDHVHSYTICCDLATVRYPDGWSS